MEQLNLSVDTYGICVEYGPEDDWINCSRSGLLLIIDPLLFFPQWKLGKKTGKEG